MGHGFALFGTAVGRCGIAWNENGIACVQLPETDESRTRERLMRMAPGVLETTPPPAVREAIAAIVGHLRREPGDLSSIRLDMSDLPPFRRQVYEITRAIPPGETLTYGAVAERLRQPGAARAVGQALSRNPFALVVPCHRVVSAGGRPGGFSANGGVTTKLGLLALEQAQPAPEELGRDLLFDRAAAVGYVRGSDPGLAGLIDAIGPFSMRLSPTVSVFDALAETITYQQLTAKAAATIHGRVRALFPDTSEGMLPEHILSATDEQLRSAGLSRPKLAALRDLAVRAYAGELPELDMLRGMDDEAIIEGLSAVRGIGRWTAQMFLIFRLGRPDVLPLDDYGIRNGFALAFDQPGLAGRAEIEERAVLWRPYRTVACWYLWEAVESARRGPSA